MSYEEVALLVERVSGERLLSDLSLLKVAELNGQWQQLLFPAPAA